MKNILLELIYWTWCLPQTLLGAIVKIMFKGKKKGKYYIYQCESGSVSLGKYVLIAPYHEYERVVRHELGHQKQSLILGPLYLFVIGISSLVWANCFEKYRQKHNISYYWFWCEAWADKLGGIKK